MAHICFVIPRYEIYSPDSGGAICTITREITKHLEHQGHRVSVVSRDGAKRYYDEGDLALIHFHPRHLRVRLIGLVRRIGHKLGVNLRRDPYLSAIEEGVHSLTAQPDVVVLANDFDAAARFGTQYRRVILWLHNYPEGPAGETLKRLPNTVRFIAVSNAVAAWTIEHCQISPQRIDVVHNGVDSDVFHPSGGSPSADDRPLRVICHGRLDPNKGHQTAARAVATLRAQGVSIEFTLIGEVSTFGMSDDVVAAYEQELDAALHAAGATRLGRVPHSELPAILGGQDVACSLPLSEDPFPLATLEAMASGCAMIVRPGGGLREMVGDAAVLVGKNDSAAVADALAKFALSPELLAAAQERARQRALEFSWQDTANGLATALEADPW